VFGGFVVFWWVLVFGLGGFLFWGGFLFFFLFFFFCFWFFNLGREPHFTNRFPPLQE